MRSTSSAQKIASSKQWYFHLHQIETCSTADIDQLPANIRIACMHAWPTRRRNGCRASWASHGWRGAGQ
eukprot:2752486-Pleurochrysis_carterae.AAC.1